MSNQIDINLTLRNNKSGEEIKSTYSVKALVGLGGWDSVMENIIETKVCNCNAVGETNVVECGCWEHWEDCTLYSEFWEEME